MAEILLFHHALGLTEGLDALAERLRAQGHVVHTPDAYSGITFDRLDDGLAHAQRIGHDAFEEVARRAARTHRAADVTVGFALGAFPAQLLAQELRRVRACALICGALPPSRLRGEWRHDVALQVHIAEPDDWIEEGSVDALMEHCPHGQLFTYPGRRHMFADPSSPDYDADAADVMEERLTRWLGEVSLV